MFLIKPKKKGYGYNETHRLLRALRKDVGRAVTVMGWAQNKRDMGGVIFIDVRDREGTLQVVFDAEKLWRRISRPPKPLNSNR